MREKESIGFTVWGGREVRGERPGLKLQGFTREGGRLKNIARNRNNTTKKKKEIEKKTIFGAYLKPRTQGKWGRKTFEEEQMKQFRTKKTRLENLGAPS